MVSGKRLVVTLLSGDGKGSAGRTKWRLVTSAPSMSSKPSCGMSSSHVVAKLWLGLLSAWLQHLCRELWCLLMSQQLAVTCFNTLAWLHEIKLAHCVNMLYFASYGCPIFLQLHILDFWLNYVHKTSLCQVFMLWPINGDPALPLMNHEPVNQWLKEYIHDQTLVQRHWYRRLQAS